MIKVITIIGTRPELIKMSRVIHELDAHVNHILVHTGQNYDYELNQIFFDDLGVRKPNYFLDAVGNTAASTIAMVIEKTDAILAHEKPDAILIYGDTNSGLAAISAKKRKIPLFHMEAGNRCFDQRVPEEINRKIIDHLSDINLVLTENARRYLISEGFPQDQIIKTGSHMDEVLDFYKNKIDSSTVCDLLGVASKKYFLVSAHREENIDQQGNLRGLIEALNELAHVYRLPIIFSTHPRTRKKLSEFSGLEIDPLIQFLKPFSFTDYVKLQIESLCVISDSGTITEEASILGFPAVTIRDAHERPEGMDEGILIMSSLRKEQVLEAVRISIAHHSSLQQKTSQVADYKGGLVSRKILKIIISYTDFINKKVWHKKTWQ